MLGSVQKGLREDLLPREEVFAVDAAYIRALGETVCMLQGINVDFCLFCIKVVDQKVGCWCTEVLRH